MFPKKIQSAFFLMALLIPYSHGVFASEQTLTPQQAIDRNPFKAFQLTPTSDGSGLYDLTINSDVDTIPNNAFKDFPYKTKIRFIKMVNVKKIGENAFGGFEKLEAVEFSENLESLGAGALKACKLLKSIKIPGKIKRIENGTFSGCYNLESVTFPEELESIGASAFCGCNLGKNQPLKLPDTVTTIESHAFSNCAGITEVELPAKLNNLGYAVFLECQNLTKVYMDHLPCGITSIDELKARPFGAFSNCPNLELANIIVRGISTKNSATQLNATPAPLDSELFSQFDP